MEKMIEIEMDLGFDEMNENFGEVLEKLNKAVPEASVKVWSYRGPGGGWPSISVIVPESKIADLGKWYGDEDAWSDVLEFNGVS